MNSLKDCTGNFATRGSKSLSPSGRYYGKRIDHSRKGLFMGDGISDYTKFAVDLRRHMWLDSVETDLRRLIWQIAVTGKYISAKIHESNRKLAGFQNVYGEDQLALDRSADEILKNQLQFSGSVREYASEEQDTIVQIGKGHEKYFITADPLDGSSLVDANLAIV